MTTITTEPRHLRSTRRRGQGRPPGQGRRGRTGYMQGGPIA
jgi:hypothetical protein